MDGVIAFWKVFAECKQKERSCEMRKKMRRSCKWTRERLGKPWKGWLRQAYDFPTGLLHFHEMRGINISRSNCSTVSRRKFAMIEQCINLNKTRFFRVIWLFIIVGKISTKQRFELEQLNVELIYKVRFERKVADTIHGIQNRFKVCS